MRQLESHRAALFAPSASSFCRASLLGEVRVGVVSLLVGVPKDVSTGSIRLTLLDRNDFSPDSGPDDLEKPSTKVAVAK